MNPTRHLSTLLFLLANICVGQSFEETSFAEITTTPSASRSANFIDVNGDGWDDIFITNGPFAGEDNMLYINNQNGTFTTINGDDIVSDSDRSDGASFADADNDGDLDAFVVTFGASGVGKKNYFYRNNGDNSFSYEPNIAMGLPLTYSEMCSWIDLNNDQNLDLYVTNSAGDTHNQYFENLGDGTFEQITNVSIVNESLSSRSIDWVDYDGDGDCDLYVTNEANSTNSLYRNDGADNFTQISSSIITLSFNNSAGSSWGDIDNDGDFDLFVANYGNSGAANQLYINNGGTFIEDNDSVISDPETSSFGSSFADIDNDGDLDLFVCNAYLASQTTNFLYINDGFGNFSLDSSSELSAHQGWTFGCAFGDYDNDGWLDALLANNLNDTQSNSVYHNTGSGNNWVKLNCQGTDSNFSSIGATVKLKALINGNEVWQTRKISSSSGYCSQNSYSVHFGLGDATEILDLVVEWPFGTTEIFSNIAVNEIHAIIEGEGSLGYEDFNYNSVKVYPNPMDDMLHISTSFASNDNPITIEVYSIQGHHLFIKTGTNKLTSIDMRSYKSGLYIYKVNQGSHTSTGKILKE